MHTYANISTCVYVYVHVNYTYVHISMYTLNRKHSKTPQIPNYALLATGKQQGISNAAVSDRQRPHLVSFGSCVIGAHLIIHEYH